MARFDGSKPGPGRPPGRRNKASKANLLQVFDQLETERPDLFRDAVMKGLQARPPASFQYLQLWAHYREGKPKDTVSVELAPALLLVDELSASDVKELKQAKDDA